MIKQISLKNIYSHKNSELNLKKYNIFIGKNGSGKSNVFKALTLLKQMILSRFSIMFSEELIKVFPLGSLHDIDEIKYKLSRDISIFSVKGDFKSVYIINQEKFLINYKTSFSIDSNNIIIKTELKPYEFPIEEIDEVNITLNSNRSSSSKETFKLLLKQANIEKNFNFTSTDSKNISELDYNNEILSPFSYNSNKRLEFNRPDVFFDLAHKFCYLNPISREKIYAQYKLLDDSFNRNSMIEKISFEEILTTIKYNEKTYIPLINQVLQSVFGKDINFDVEIKEKRTLHPIISIKNESFDLYNTASGLKFILDLIIQIILISEESTICIDEPEIHIDANRQGSLLKSILDLCKDRNNQLILVTHSEHIINSISAICKKYKDKYNPDDFAIFHFEIENEGYTEINQIKINKDGSIQDMPVFKDVAEKEFKNSLTDESDSINV